VPQAKRYLESMLQTLTQRERDALIGPKGGAKSTTKSIGNMMPPAAEGRDEEKSLTMLSTGKENEEQRESDQLSGNNTVSCL
jgi:ribosomal protein L13